MVNKKSPRNPNKQPGYVVVDDIYPQPMNYMGFKYFDIVYRYLEGELNETELDKFIEDLKTNSELQNELAEQTKLNEFLKDKDTFTFMGRVKQIEKKIKNNNPKN